MKTLSELIDQRAEYGFYREKEMLSEFAEAKVLEKVRKTAQIRETVDTREKHKEYAQQLREKYIENLGVLPYDPTHPLNAKVVGVLEEGDLTMEKVIFESRPNVYITANVYVPKKRDKKCGAVLFVIGHAEEGKACKQYQKVARRIAKRGLIVMLYDPTGQGERLNYVESGLNTPMVDATVWDHIYFGNQCMLMGDSPAGYFIADAMRAVDYLVSRPDVDSDKIGITGSSGGGTLTCHMMICDPRIKAAAPGTFVTSREAYMKTRNPQDAEQIWLNSLCYGFDFPEILICFAPKPVMILAVEYDFFVIEGAEDVMDITRRFWKMYGSDECHMVVDQSMHKYTDVLAEHSANFFGRLFGAGCENDIHCDRYFPAEAVACTKAGQVLMEFANAIPVFDENKQRYQQYGGICNEKLADFLREKMYFEREDIRLHLKHCDMIWYEHGLRYTSLLWLTQKGLPNYAYLITDFQMPEKPEAITVLLTDGGTKDLAHNIYKIRQLIKEGRGVLVVDFSGIGQSGPQGKQAVAAKGMYNHDYNINMNLMLCGDSICALHLFELDVLIKILRENITNQISLYAEGRMANLAGLYKEVAPDMEITLGEHESYQEIVQNKYYEGYGFPEILMPGILKYLQPLSENGDKTV